MTLCEFCGTKISGFRCKACTMSAHDPDIGDKRIRSFVVANIVNKMLGRCLDENMVAWELEQHLRSAGFCPVCMAVLPVVKFTDAAGSTDYRPGSCPRCGEGKEKRKP